MPGPASFCDRHLRANNIYLTFIVNMFIVDTLKLIQTLSHTRIQRQKIHKDSHKYNLYIFIFQKMQSMK